MPCFIWQTKPQDRPFTSGGQNVCKTGKYLYAQNLEGRGRRVASVNNQRSKLDGMFCSQAASVILGGSTQRLGGNGHGTPHHLMPSGDQNRCK